MSERNRDGDALDAELARLRDALHEVNAADGREESLRAAFRAHRAAIVQRAPVTSAPEPPERGTVSRVRALRRLPVDFLAGALAASIVIAAAVLVGLGRIDRDTAESATAAREASAPSESDVHEIAATAAFQPLSYSPEISPTQAYTIVRVRVPLTALGVAYDIPPNATIEADLLLGEDGIPAGIRFDTTNAQLVSMASD
jgi:hypothetical protein